MDATLFRWFHEEFVPAVSRHLSPETFLEKLFLF
jgi:hypothetical protein